MSSIIILEYISANPTGPFHIGHGRWAAMGSALGGYMQGTTTGYAGGVETRPRNIAMNYIIKY